MLTVENIESTGFKLGGAMSNGGTLLFAYQDRYMIQYHGENFIFKNNYPERLTQIEIKEVQLPSLKFKTLFEGECLTTEHLLQILNKLGIC